MQLSPHALPAEHVLQQPSTGMVDQGILSEGSGRLMIDAGSAGVKMPAIATAAIIRNMAAPPQGRTIKALASKDVDPAYAFDKTLTPEFSILI
jgi:hypothetical protein